MQLPVPVPGQQRLDSVVRIQKVTDGYVVVQSVDEQSDVLAHIAVYIIRAAQELRSLVYQVGGKELRHEAVLIGLVELSQAVGEQGEGAEDKDAVSAAALQFLHNLDHALAGGNHIVHDDHILALDRKSVV